jgi:O-antigen/teichoic acid export membrane protein
MLPRATQMVVVEGGKAVRDFHRRYSRISDGLSFPVFLLTCALAPLLLFAWLGQIPPEAVPILVVLSLAHISSVGTAVANVVALGAGMANLVAATAAASAGLNLVLTVVLAPWLKTWGVVIGTFIAITIGALIFMQRFQRHFGIPTRESLSSFAGPLGLATVLAIPLIGVSIAVGHDTTRLGAVAIVIAGTAAYVGVYLPLAARLGYLPGPLANRVLRLTPATVLAR